MSTILSIVTFYLFIYFITCINAQRVTIYSWPFTHNISGWRTTLDYPNVVTDTKCPSASTCYHLTNNEEIYIYIDTRTYKDIQIGYDIRTSGATATANNPCEFWWIRGNASIWDWLKWTTAEAKHNGITIENILHTSLSSDLDDYSSIGMDFWAKSGSNHSCYLNNIVVMGIPITTAPTAIPSETPSTVPTAEPSETPSALPTLPTAIPTNAREGEVQHETDAYVTTEMDGPTVKAADDIGIVEYVMYGSIVAALCLCGGSTAVVIYCWCKKRAPQKEDVFVAPPVPPVAANVTAEFGKVMDDAVQVMNLTKGKGNNVQDDAKVEDMNLIMNDVVKVMNLTTVKEKHENDDGIEDDMDLVPTMADESEEGENEGGLDLTEAPHTPPIANSEDIDHGDLDLVPTLGSDELPPHSQCNDDVDHQIANYMMTKK